MAVVTVRRPGKAAKVGDGLVLASSAGRVEFPLLPDQLEHGDLAATWSQIGRPGRTPLLVRQERPLETYRIDAELQTTDRSSIADIIATLQKMAHSSKPVTLTVGKSKRGLFRITELACPELAWNAAGKPIEARAIFTLTEPSDVPARKGPVK